MANQKPVKSTRRKPSKPSTVETAEPSIIIEEHTNTSSMLGKSSGWGDDDNWDTDNWDKPKSTSLAAQKKAERDAKNKARKAELEKKRNAKKGLLGARKKD